MTTQALAFDVLLHRYMQQLELLNYSPRTSATQATYFHRFGEFLAEAKITDVQTVTEATLADFQRWLFYQPTAKGTARTVSSQNRAVSALKTFLRSSSMRVIWRTIRRRRCAWPASRTRCPRTS